MAEALILTSNKEAAGMSVIDVRTGSSLCAGFKNCIAEAGALCAIGSSNSSYAGYGSSGDYLAVAQAKKPCINIWQWGKPQAHFQCHIQEIVTTLAADPQGAFLFAGTQKGWIYCWELATGELITAFQAHFKAITRIAVSKVGLPFCISVAEDGTGRAWELHKMLDIAEAYKHVGRQSISPFRTWSAHTLPIKDCVLFDTLTTTRVLTCSLDRTIVLYDVLQAQVCLRVTLPQSLESVACNATQDLVCAGASNGSIYLVDLTSTAIAVTAAHAHVSHHYAHSGSSRGSASASSSGIGGALPAGTCSLEGHTKAVTSVRFSADNTSLVSASMDGTVRVWNVWTRQCVREFTPLAKHAITNAMLIPVPETLSIGVTRPTFCPVGHLNKYLKGQQSQSQHQHQQQGGAGGSASSAGSGAGGSAGSAQDANAVVLGPSFLSRHVQAPPSELRNRRDLGAEKQKQQQQQQQSRRLSSEPVQEDELAMVTGDEPADEAEEEEDFMALSGAFDAPQRKAKMGSRKRRSLMAAEALQDEGDAEDAVRPDVSASVSSPIAATGAAVTEGEGSARKKAKQSPVVAEAEVPEEVVLPEEDEPSPRARDSRDRANRRKSVAPSARARTAALAESAEEDTPAVEVEPAVVPAAVTSRDRANRRKSVAPGKAGLPLPLPAIDEDAPLQMPAETATITAGPTGGRASRRKSVSAKDLPTDSTPSTAATAPRTPPHGEENSDLESIYSVGGTRSRVKKSVQFSGQDQVKLITPHKLPGFCDSFQNGVGSASKVAAQKKSAGGNGKGGKGRK